MIENEMGPICEIGPETFTATNLIIDEEADAAKENTPFDKVEAVLKQHYYEPDIEAARALYSAVAAHGLRGQPVWVMLIAPPGSLKTELLRALDGMPNVHLLDQITPKTLISGQIEDPEKPHKNSSSLLHRIGSSGLLVFADFSTILGMNPIDKRSIFADLRRVYDGDLHKEYGTADDAQQREWHGRVTVVVAVTPEIDRQHSVCQSLGERFLMIRWARVGGIEAGLIALDQDTEGARRDLKQAVHEALDGLPTIEPEIPFEVKVKIAALGDFAAQARSHVARSSSGDKEIVDIPVAESATRLSQQLAQLAKGSARLDRRPYVNEVDFGIVRRLALDCIPPIRQKVIQALIATGDPTVPGMPASTRSYAVADLEALGLMAGGELSPDARHLLDKAGFSPFTATAKKRMFRQA